MFPTLPKDWNNLVLKSDQAENFFKTLKEVEKFYLSEVEKGATLFPPPLQIFRALELCSVENTKVIILGQDPYHGDHQAHGLAFSVNKEIPLPPSLKNIFKERETDLGISSDTHGDLSSWAKQGVLLLNATLTVEKGKAGSHQKKGQEYITQTLINLISLEKKNLVFILWGSHAQKCAAKISSHDHCLLSSVHPSPLSSYRGFFGSKPFSKTNKYLKSHGLPAINWENT